MKCKSVVACIGLCVAVAASAEAQVVTVELATDTQHREIWRGETASAAAGFFLDRGDVSAGDSRRDLIVGSPGWTSNTGRVYVLFSGRVRRGEVSLSQAEAILTGGAAGDRFGEATAAGYITALESSGAQRDLVVGAPNANGGAGAVYMFLRGFTIGQRLGVADARLTIVGAPAGARLGASLATGDVDGDGYREIIIGAPGVGAVYVVHGGPAVTGTIDLSTAVSGFFKIQGAAADGVGRTLAAGDVTGDNIYDLAIGAADEGGKGAVYLVRGRSSNTFPATMTLATEADARFGGIDAGDGAGRSLDIAPLDGDGISDLVIGAPDADGPANNRSAAGEIYILWGGATLASRALSTANVTIYGAANGHREGADVATGDVNRNAPHDLVSAAPGISPAGEVHLINGRSRSSWPALFDLSVTPMDRRVVNDPAAGTLSTTLAYDLTGEGLEDIVLGMPATAQGLVYISISQSAYVPPGTALPALPGDLDGDAKPDLLWWNAATGEMIMWKMNGSSYTAYARMGSLPSTGWRIAATADFNNDGHLDLLLRNTVTGDNSVWFMNGATKIGEASLTNASDQTWQIVGAADFNGDLKADIFWRNSVTGQNIIWYMNGVTFLSSAYFTELTDVRWTLAGTGDFDGDGSADLLWRNATTGENVIWYLLNGVFSRYARILSVAEAGWNIAMVADFDQDGDSDIVWRNESTGENYLWIMADAEFVRYEVMLSVSDANWYLQRQPPPRPGLGVSDFNADAKTDILWRNTSTGENIVWYLNDGSYSNYGRVDTVADTNWRSMAVADFNADGKPDILWRNVSTGEVSVWFMNGIIHTATVSLGSIPVVWRIAGAADFNSDGYPDIVWRNTTTGEDVLWFMNGTAAISQVSLPTVADTSWQIRGLADFNRDGKTDILWRHAATGENIVWFMNGAAYASYDRIAAVTDMNWTIVGAADYNRDGKADVLWRNPSTGENIIWFMNGVSYVSYVRLVSVNDPNWKIGQQQ